MKIFYSRFLIYVYLIFCCSKIYAFQIPANLQSGDLIFREGDETISDIIKTFDNSGFSHVGILDIQANKIYVIHATPKEHDQGISGVNRDTLEYFISRSRNKKVAFYSILANEISHQIAYQQALSRLGENFSIDPNKGVYCTQLIQEAWQAAGISIATGRKKVQLPLLPVDIIFPMHLIESKHVRLHPTKAP